MQHKMSLNEKPFNQIKSGTKTIELRLYDEKRRVLNVGDIIEFKNRADTSQTILCEITALHVFNSFKALYAALPLLEFGYTADELSAASPDDMDAYYSKEEQHKYGVVGIELKVL